MHKKLQTLFIILSIVFTFGIALSLPVSAAETTGYFEGRSGDDCGNFLGLTSWDCGVGAINDMDTLKAGIGLIAANVFTDATIIAAYLVLGYVIYGGYLYVFSSGEPGKVATAKKTLTQAFIGLAIVMSATIILNSIRIALLGSKGSFAKNCAVKECVDASKMINNLIQWVIGIVGFVSAIFVVYGGVSYITSSGDPGKVKKAKDAILYALIGLAVVALSEVIIAFITNAINDSNKTSLFLDDKVAIEKEFHEN